MTSRFRIIAAATTLGATLLCASPAPCQSDRALAETLFEEGRKLMAEERYAEACEKLDASLRAAPAGGTTLNLALCYEKLGRVATSWGLYREALTLARRDEREERIAFAEEHIAAVEPRVPRLTIRVAAPPPPELAVKVQGKSLPAGAWNMALPVDPGRVEIVATAPGYETARVVVELGEGARRTTRLELSPKQRTPLPLPASPAAEPRHEPAGSPRQGPNLALRVSGGVAMGLGAAAIGVAVPFHLQREADAEEWNGTDCERPVGRSRLQQCGHLKHDLDVNGTAATVLYAAGGGLLVTGAVLWLLATSPASERPATALSCDGTAGLGRYGIACKGRF